MNIKSIAAALFTMVASGAIAQSALDTIPDDVYLFQNVRVFDGTTDELQDVDVLVVGNKIQRIGKDLPTSGTYAIDVDGGNSREVLGGFEYSTNTYRVIVEGEDDGPQTKDVAVQIIDGGGRTLMPGLIDSHVHFAGYTPFNIDARQNVTEFMVGGLSMVRGQSFLMRGFTTVRDTGGPSTYLRKLFDPHMAPGPRVYGSEAMITQTGGHGDFRGLTNRNPLLADGAEHWYERYLAVFADGPTEVRRATREAYRNGADFFKVFVSGGVSSEFDPLHALQFTQVELKAAVEIAEQNKTYVTAHCQTVEGAHHAIDAGIKMLEHVPMIGGTPEEIDEVVQRIVDTGTYVEFNNGSVLARPPEVLKKTMSPASFEKALLAINSIDLALKSFAEHQDNLTFVFGTDAVAPWGQAAIDADTGALPADFDAALKHFSNLSVLKAITSNGGLVAELTGPNNPYPDGKLGVIQEGAYADILLIEGNPLENPKIIFDTENAMDLVMKDGVIYRNALEN